MAPGLLAQPDPDHTTAIVYATANATASPFTFFFSSNSGLTYQEPPNFYKLRVTMSMYGFLDDCWAEILRQLNMEPSAQGVATARQRYNKLMTQVRSLWIRHIRFDLRQPCWRGGRWKSLTS